MKNEGFPFLVIVSSLIQPFLGPEGARQDQMSAAPAEFGTEQVADMLAEFGEEDIEDRRK